MRELAVILGHSLLFPTHCWYCGALIYLFAGADGGFAIFEQVGKPWPKHSCSGIDPDEPRYAVTNPTFAKSYQLPVPADASLGTPVPGTRLTGTIISNGPPAELFDGNHFYRLVLPKGVQIGTCVSGVVGGGDPPLLIDLVTLQPDDVSIVLKAPTTSSSQPTRLKSLSPQDMWRLQRDVEAIRTSVPDLAKSIDRALEALLNGHTPAGVCLLAWLVQVRLDELPSDARGHYVSLVFRAFRERNLETCAPAVAATLSRESRRALDAETAKLVDDLASIGKLSRKLGSLSRVRRRVESWLRRDSRYVAGLVQRAPELARAVTAFKGLLGHA